MVKKFEDISCILCGDKNTTKDSICNSCHCPLDVQNDFLESVVNSYTLKKYKARGFYGLTYKAVDDFGKKVAIKLISKKSYEKYNKDFHAEAKLFANLTETPSIVTYLGAGETILEYHNTKIDFFYIISEWIDGISLRKIISSGDLSPEDLYIASKDLLLGLQVLYDKNLWHNDLHDENVLVTQINRSTMRLFNRTSSKLFKIIDVGSMVYKNPSDVKTIGDIVSVGHHLFQIIDVLNNQFSSLSKEDQYFIDIVREVCSQMIDENPSRNFSSPSQALDRIEMYYQLSLQGERQEQKKLDNPYGYINANDIPSPWLLKHMFSDMLNYFRDIMSHDQQSLLITGPRGCGKTMILKNMRFTTIFDSLESGKNSDVIIQLPYIGLFLSARTDFGNYLVSYRPQKWAKDEAKVMLYFNILVTMEFLSVIYRLHKSQYIDDNVIKIITDLISVSFQIPHLQLNTIKSHLITLAKKIINDQELDILINNSNSTPDFINKLFLTLRSASTIIKDKDIIILVDDLSLPRVPIEIQKAVIPAIFNTGANYKTRVTAHSDGLITQDLAGETYKGNRDFREINLGYEYWELSNSYDICLKCFDDILTKRFELASRETFPGIEIILGHESNLENPGKYIYELKKAKKLRSLCYNGSNVFIKLCSGDLSSLLDILGKMELRSPDKDYPIGKKIQNDVIRNYARIELRSLQDIKAQYVPSLYNIAYYFGALSKSKVIEKGKEYLKIEVEVENLTEELKTTLRELLCYGIFIDAGHGNNSDGRLSRKLYFRRIFTPAFPTTFHTRNTFPMRKNSFEKFIFEPANFARARMSEDNISPDEQQKIEQLELWD